MGDGEKTIGARLLAWRIAMCISQKEAALLCKTTQGRWSKWESGASRPNRESLLRIAEAASLPLAELVELSALRLAG